MTLNRTSVINVSLRWHKGEGTRRDAFIEMEIQQPI